MKSEQILKVLAIIALGIFLLHTVGIGGCILLAIGYYLYHTIFVFHGTFTKWFFIGIGLGFVLSFSQFLSTTAFIGCTLYGGYLRIKEVK